MKCMAFLVLSAVAVASLAGCGASDPFEYVPVSGKVTYDDGSEIPDALQVTFVPQTPPADSRTHARLAEAEMKDDATFDRATTYKPGDGIVRGKHKVVIQAFTENHDASDAVPPEYADPEKTPLEVDTADYSPEKPFHFKVAKPKADDGG